MGALLLAPLLTFALSACGGGGGSDAASSSLSSAPATARASAYGVTQSNLQIAQLVYSDSQRTPTGFYSETVPVFSGYVATSQLKTRDINPSAVLQYELCTDDYNQALAWSDTYNSVSGDNASISSVDTGDARFFEFDRIRSGTPNGYLRQRVYKCSYLSRTTVDLTASSGDAGTLNARPLDATTLKTLSEYLWQFTTYNNYGNVVLTSSGSTNGNTRLHTLVMASLTHGNTGQCDTIDLIAWQHSVDLTTGDLTLSVSTLDSFQAQEVSNNVSVCL